MINMLCSICKCFRIFCCSSFNTFIRGLGCPKTILGWLLIHVIKTTRRNINLIFIEINFMTSCRFLCVFSPISSSLDGFHGNGYDLLCQVIKMFQILHFIVISALEKIIGTHIWTVT